MTDLVASWMWGDLDLTAPPFGVGFGSSDFGAPETATEGLAQLLLDGEDEVSARASNRTLGFTVYIESNDLLDAAESERLLALEADRARNTLTFDPGDGYAPLTVFETFRAQLAFVADENAEAIGLRRYDVTMKASPFSRSAVAVETLAQPVIPIPTVTTINAGTSVTNWAATSGTLSAGSGSLTINEPTRFRPAVRYTSPTPIDLSTARLVTLVVNNPINAPILRLNDTVAPLVAVKKVTSGTSRYYWEAPGGVTSATSFSFSDGGIPNFTFSSLQRTDYVPESGTGRQKQRTVVVNGSARTRGSLAIEHATSALGSVLVYTWQGEEAMTYSPPLRALRVSGGTVIADAALVSGARDLIDTPVVFDVPVDSLIEGAHLLLARVRSDTTGDLTIRYSAQLRVADTDIGPAISSFRVSTFFTANTWRNVVLGRMALPPTGVPAGSTAVVRVTIWAGNPAGANIDLDEAWLFNTSVGDLTWVECGSSAPTPGGSSNRLWLDTATTERPRPTIYRGNAADRTDATFPPDVRSFGIHSLEPPVTSVFVVTSNAVEAAVSLRHFAAWHTHAAS